MTVTSGAAVGQGALGIDGTQPDLFDATDDAPPPDAWGAPSTGPDGAVALLGADPGPETQGIARFLGSEAFTTLAARDRGSSLLVGTRLHLEVRLPEAGHTFTVVSAVEREVRRLEGATADVSTGRSDARLAAALSDGHPRHAHPGGLRIVRAGGSDGTLSLTLEPVDADRTPLSRWPRLSLALAASAVADLGFRLVDSTGARFRVELARQRWRVVAGGLPDGAVTMLLTGRHGGLTRQVTVVTTGEPAGRGVDPAVN